jgi:hypothetical protein
MTTALCIYTEFDGDFAHIKAYACKPALSTSGQPEPVDRYEHSLHDVRLHSPANRGYHWTGMYGLAVTIECHDRIDLALAKNALVTLAPLDRKLAKLQAQEGEAKSYGQWLNRVARALGAKTVYFKNAKGRYIGATGGDIVCYGDAAEQTVAEWANPVAVAA